MNNSQMPPPPSVRYAGGFIPNLVIAGVPKSGTSSLFNWLAGHPDVMASREKETYFLLDKGTHMFRPKATVLNGLQGYTAYFDQDKGQNPVVVMESTPKYIYGELPLATLAAMPSQPKVVFVLREPTAQIYSLFRFFQSNWNWIPHDMTFAQFVQQALNGTAGDYKGNELATHAIENAKYVQFLRQWRDVLGADRMRIYLFDDLHSDPLALVQDLCAFVGLDPSYFDDYTFWTANETFDVRLRFLHKLNIAIRGFLPRGALYQMGRRMYRWINTTKAHGNSDVDKVVLARLKAEFVSANRDLAREFGLNLQRWGV